MGLRFRRRIGLRFALLGLGLIVVAVLSAVLVFGSFVTFESGQSYAPGGGDSGRLLTVGGIGWAAMLGVLGAVVLYAYSQHALRRLDHLQRALTGMIDTLDDPDQESPHAATFEILDHETQKALSRLRGHVVSRQGAELREIAITRAVLDNSKDGVITIDDHGRVLSFNAAAEVMFGWTGEDIKGRNVSELMPSPHSDKHDKFLREHRRGGRKRMIGRETEVLGLRADYTTFPMQMAVSELELDGSRVFTAIVRDISERKRAEDALASSEARMRAILDTAADGIITLDEWGTVVSINAAAEAMFRSRAYEVVGKHIGELMTASTSASDSDGSPEAGIRYVKWLQAAARNAQSSNGNNQAEKPDPLPADDTTLEPDPAESAPSEPPEEGGAGYGDALAVAMAMGRNQSTGRDEDRGPRSKSSDDSADERAAEQEGPPSGNGLSAARANQPGNGSDPASGDTPGRALDGVGHRSDGSTFPVELAISEVKIGSERIFTAIVRDVTERTEAEAALARRAEELVRRNEELAQFAYVASHDLQEPLRMVSSYTQLLERRYKGQLDEDADEFISYAVDGANRMQRLLRALLAYSRIGTHGLSFQPTDCEAALARALANLEDSVHACGAVVTSDALPTVIADPSQMDQLLQNLVSNAIKFHDGEAPRVHVTAEHLDGEWCFAFRDNGVGIDPQYHERIFIIFQRLHTKDEYPGTGIGLAICKKIVERHGGRIWVESVPEGGSTFLFTLPEVPDGAEHGYPTSISASQPSDTCEEPGVDVHYDRQESAEVETASVPSVPAYETPVAATEDGSDA